MVYTNLAGVASCFLLGCATTASGAADRTADRLLSEALPPELAQFVGYAESDRELDLASASLLDILGCEDPDVDTVVELLRPKTHLIVAGPRLLARIDPPEHPIAGVGEPEALIVAGTLVQLPEEDVPFQSRVFVGDLVEAGTLLNAGPGTLVLRDPAAPESGDIFVYAGEAVTLGKTCRQSCSTSCGTGYYACCYSDSNGCAHCPCVQNGTTPAPTCTEAGGPGSTSCSQGVTSR